MKKFLRWLLPIGFLICCLMALASCGAPALPAPKNLKTDLEELRITWDPIEEAESYDVWLKGEEGEPITDSVKLNAYSFSRVEAGEYTIKVKAVAAIDAKKKAGKYSDSEWSEELTFAREAETGLLFKPINGNKEYEVSGMGTASGNIVIPATYRGKAVTRIGDAAFSGKSRIKSIVIPDSVNRIGARAFYNCLYLENVTMPDSITRIGEFAFQSCRALKEIKIPQGLTSIGSYVFSFCSSLESIEIGENVTSFGDYAFSSCSNLKEITIPDNVKSCGKFAFSSNSALEKVTFGNGLTAVSEGMFQGCEKLTEINFSSSITSIGSNAFAGCLALEKFAVPENIETIGDYAFYGCSLLGEVETSDKGALKTMGVAVFAGTKIWTDADNIVYAGNWAVGCKDPETTGTLQLENGTVGVAASAFALCAFTQIRIPDSVKYLGDSSFYGCATVTAVAIGNGVLEIGPRAFCNCTGLRTIVYGNDPQVQVIGDYAFYGCTNLEPREDMIIVPDTVREVGTYAFKASGIWEKASSSLVYAGKWLVGTKSENLTRADTIREDTVGLSNYCFFDSKGAIQLVVLPNSVKYMGRSAFQRCENLQVLILSESLEEIRYRTFYRCYGLAYCMTAEKYNIIREKLTEEQQNWEGSNEEFGRYFANKYNLVDIPESVTKICRGAFYECANVLSVYLPDSVTEIEPYAFYSNLNMQKLRLSENLVSIADRAFSGCLSVSEIVIPDSVTSFGAHVFDKCESLTSVEIGSGISEIMPYTFSGCISLEQITIPTTVKTVGNYAFRNCAGLKEVTFEEGVEKIGDYAFRGCVALEHIVFPESVKSLGSRAFFGCSTLKSMTLSNRIENIADHAVNGCKEATFYLEGETEPAGWSVVWNSSSRPVIYGCTLSTDGSYVVSFVKSENAVVNKTFREISDPYRAGYEFGGWTATIDGEEKTVVFSVNCPKAEEENSGESGVQVPEGAVLYEELPDGMVISAIWTALQ